MNTVFVSMKTVPSLPSFLSAKKVYIVSAHPQSLFSFISKVVPAIPIFFWHILLASILILLASSSSEMLSFTSLSIATAIATLLLGTDAGPLLAERWAPELPTCTNTTDFVYAGCFIDPSSPSALLFRTDLNSQNMTVEICIDFCKGKVLKFNFYRMIINLM